jgi:xylan 1,4-beta-xylosidase
MTLRSVPDGFQNFVNQVRSEREKRGLRNTPIFLTEWNNTPSQQDLLNDTCFKSCYIVKNILENYDKLDSFGYWSLTDLMGDAPLPDKMFFGGLGLFTKNGIAKPTFYAMKLMNQLTKKLKQLLKMD